VDFETVEQDFFLPSGSITIDPTDFNVTLVLSTSLTLPMILEDIGGSNVEFSISEVPGTDPFAQPAAHVPASDGNFPRGPHAPSMGAVPTSDGAVAGAPATSTLQELLGSVAYGLEHANLFYTIFDTDTPETLPNVAPAPPTGGFIGAGEVVGDKAYMVDTTNAMWEVDAATGAILNTYTATPPGGGETYSGLALDPTSGVVYAGTTSCGTSSLYTIDAPTGAATLVGPVTNGGCLIALAVDGDGELWGYDIIADVLLNIDKTTGAGTVIGSIGFDANFGQGMGWDPETDTLYMAAFNNGLFQPELRSVDRTTGNTTLIGVLGSTSPGGLCQVSWLGFELAAADVPWVSEVPISGTVPADSTFTVDVTFDAAQVPVTGTYTAFLNVAVDSPQLELVVPLTMNVVLSGTAGVTVDPDQAGEGIVGSSVSYALDVTNDGSITDMFALSAVSSQGWNVSLPGNIILNPGETGTLTVIVDIPAGATLGDVDVTTVTATSTFDGSVSDSADLTTTVVAYGVDLEADQSGQGAPGDTVTYTLTVENTGTTTDTIDLVVAGNAWATTLSDNSVTLAAGDSATIVVSVVISGTATNGESDVATVTATSQGDPTQTDSVTVTTTAVTGYNVYLPLVINE
jgi:uncharacterized repeat protein (TIGR01451 family)